MASFALPGASIALPWRQFGPGLDNAIERKLEAERDQLPLWLPVALGGGITTWFVVPDRHGWTVALLLFLAIGAGALALAGTGGWRGRWASAAWRRRWVWR